MISAGNQRRQYTGFGKCWRRWIFDQPADFAWFSANWRNPSKGNGGRRLAHGMQNSARRIKLKSVAITKGQLSLESIVNNTIGVSIMARQIVFTPKAAKPPATYSQAVKAAGLVFVSGTAPTDPVTGTFKGTTIQEQTRQCMTNIQAILVEAGSSLEKIVSATVVLADEEDFAGMNEEWLKWFPANPPARQGAKLPVRVPGLKVSIAAIAEA